MVSLTPDPLLFLHHFLGLYCDDSFGVMKIEQDSDLTAVVEECTLTWSIDQESYKNFPDIWLVEKYLDGPVVSVDGIVVDGDARFAGIVEIEMGPEPRFTQIANHLPPQIDLQLQERCLRLVRDTIDALRLDTTPFHCELRLAATGPALIEIGARLPGGTILKAYEEAYGVDLLRSAVALWVGQDVRIVRESNLHVIQKGVFPSRSGRLVGISGADEARQLRGVREVLQVTDVGDEVVTYPSTPVPIYYYEIVSESCDEARDLAKHVEDRVRFHIE